MPRGVVHVLDLVQQLLPRLVELLDHVGRRQPGRRAEGDFAGVE
jgi:hypothetical protein